MADGAVLVSGLSYLLRECTHLHTCTCACSLSGVAASRLHIPWPQCSVAGVFPRRHILSESDHHTPPDPRDLWGALAMHHALHCLLIHGPHDVVLHRQIHYPLVAPSQLAAVQFHLINTVILFSSREGFRRGCLRTPLVRGSPLRLCSLSGYCMCGHLHPHLVGSAHAMHQLVLAGVRQQSADCAAHACHLIIVPPCGMPGHADHLPPCARLA
jgi:hypothetical protein